ncbi:PREDICTED: putative pentatricopeptide repeat-containing protein At3g25060, mitochondrial [Tarenaya hassleriana]|uniref:putative pentatricopeptide repeat-containing protein At3g25060, mitochondrial n=1 Tax=Tarenaya hassleriana TaxID=28532 RepID=UPI00053C1665|nr:PREDICTED: putative pentatricopeptide repeat-containing protein At3g25060, mitochondrial [Tarenaya hassleriana]
MLPRNLQCPRRLKSLLSACKYKRPITQTHALIVATGYVHHGISIFCDLIASYGRIGEISHAWKVFDELPHRSVSAYNSMVVAYSRGNNPEEVVRLYNQMIDEGFRPDSSTFTVTIKACVKLMIMEEGERVWGKAVESGYGNDVFVCSSALNLYSKCRKMDEATVLFRKMTKKDLISWTTMVTGLAQAGEPVKALEFYRKMQTEGMNGDGIVILGVLQACADLGDRKTGLSVHGYLIRRDLPMNIVIETSLVDMYAKVGLLELACRFFNSMTDKNTVSWAALISGFAQNGFSGNAIETLVEMQNRGFRPDLVSLVGVLSACSQTGSLKTGKSIHSYILKRHVLDQVLATALVDMYSKCGALSRGRTIFDQMERRDLISWNTMISCYGIHGNGREALEIFLQMTESNVKPDHATFASLLSALSHSGLVEQGQHWFGLMINKYKIQPREKHYVCMVDLLARAGRAEEAVDTINSAENLDPGLPIWVALLSGCINHRNFSVGEMAARKILELNPDESGVQALVSNFFAMAEKWKEVANVRKMMRSSEMEKVPGFSAIEVNGKLEAFLMEDMSHTEHHHMLQVLQNLDSEMREKYYMSLSI